MLYIVASPIGNLEDISERAKRILTEVDFVLAEDTRQSGKLLNHLKADSSRLAGARSKNIKLISCHEHSDKGKLDYIISELKSGKSAAYLSDAGTPNLSDPGGKLVEAARDNNIEVSPIPGPSALTTLISIAPFSCSQFVFLGYFPKKKGREKMITQIQTYEMPVFFYESPHRIQKTLELLAARLTDYKILIGRELTKKFEQVIFADINDRIILDQVRPQGEFVLGLVKQSS